LEEIKRVFVDYLAWIASKVKAVAPVLPSGDATTVSPSVNNELPKVPGGSMAIPGEDKPSTKRRGHGRRKTKTTPATTTNSAASSDDEPGEYAAKAAIKRVIRALFNRQ
jgi:hypothetical protein